MHKIIIFLILIILCILYILNKSTFSRGGWGNKGHLRGGGIGGSPRWDWYPYPWGWDYGYPYEYCLENYNTLPICKKIIDRV